MFAKKATWLEVPTLSNGNRYLVKYERGEDGVGKKLSEIIGKRVRGYSVQETTMQDVLKNLKKGEQAAYSSKFHITVYATISEKEKKEVFDALNAGQISPHVRTFIYSQIPLA